MKICTFDGYYAQKNFLKFVRFVNTYFWEPAIIITVKTPNTLYIFFATPHNKNEYLLQKDSTPKGCPFYYPKIA